MKLILTVAFAMIATSAMAQDLSVRLKDGASWTITGEHTRAVGGGGPANNWSVTTVKQLTWHAGAKGKPATLTVTPISATPGPNSPPEIAQARSLAIPATVVVDTDLSPHDVVNRDEVRAEFRRLAPSATDDDIAMIDLGAKAMIVSELGIASRGQGLGLKVGRPVSAEAAIANPFGGKPLKGVESVELVSIDKAHDQANIRWRQTLDQAAFRAMMLNMIAALGSQKLSPEKLAEGRAAMSSANYDNHVDCDYAVDLRSGLATHAICRIASKVSMQGKGQDLNETWFITQTLPDKS